ncbi:MAG TPA: metallophosphoesterase [Candidatus Acidoferrum sp.]|jgi:3',5'-cyclic AMP phosphodiesterase CpdA|nr:metallophosphoesterase [Candidatus Acidoferrum sp.]
MILDRRKFLRTAAATAFGSVAAFDLVADATIPGSFDFVFFTDTHIEPELEAPHGCTLCYKKIAALKPEFAIMGGDHVYDATSVGAERANTVFDLYKKTEQSLQMPIHHAIGNHDPFGIIAKSGVPSSDPVYGKKMYEDRIGKTYYSFDHRGYHFVVLDSIQPTEDRLWEARIDENQMSWVAEDLKSTGADTPVVGVVHVPLVTAFGTFAAATIRTGSKYNMLTVANAPQVLALFEGHNVIAVLQGHTHVNEIVEYKNTKFNTSGAVCGNWWHGPRMGVPEGFTVVSLREGKIITRYEASGFQSVDVREKF